MSAFTPESLVINGQLVGVREEDAFAPILVGPSFMGYQTPVPSPSPAMRNVAAMPSSNSNLNLGDSASAVPLVAFAALLIVGLLGLRYVHWG